jgi:hypothetical protein
MKTQLSKPARHQARYTEEYKEALELWRNSVRSAAREVTGSDFKKQLPSPAPLTADHLFPLP